MSRMTAPLSMRQTTNDLSTAAARLVDASRAMRQVRALATRAAAGDAKVFITGESGVGKDVVAQYIHAHSARATRPFIAVNCAAIADTLLETELFGHARGSFTGAYRDRMGRLEAAHRGTIFLDEIAEMSLQMQAHLLRFLETGEIQPVGSVGGPIKVDVRIISATNRDLEQLVSTGAFRSDLLYRIKVVHIHVPPLRDRKEDLPTLIEAAANADGPADPVHRVGAADARALSVARQRPRAAERHRTGRLDVRIAGRGYFGSSGRRPTSLDRQLDAAPGATSAVSRRALQHAR